jgi:hypothetical protein
MYNDRSTVFIPRQMSRLKPKTENETEGGAVLQDRISATLFRGSGFGRRELAIRISTPRVGVEGHVSGLLCNLSEVRD